MYSYVQRLRLMNHHTLLESRPQTPFVQSNTTIALFLHDTQLLKYTPYHSTIVPMPWLTKSKGSGLPRSCPTPPARPSVANEPRCTYSNAFVGAGSRRRYASPFPAR